MNAIGKCLILIVFFYLLAMGMRFFSGRGKEYYNRYSNRKCMQILKGLERIFRFSDTRMRGVHLYYADNLIFINQFQL